MHSVSAKMIIETFQDYFSISSFDRKHQGSFYNVLVLHKLYKVCVTHGQDENYLLGSQKFLSFSDQNSIWICWDVGVKVAIDFQTSGLHNCRGKVAQIATKCLGARWRKLEPLKYSWEVSMIILLDIQCYDFSWIFGCRVFSFLSNCARE